jgi:hypothetical protein
LNPNRIKHQICCRCRLIQPAASACLVCGGDLRSSVSPFEKRFNVSIIVAFFFSLALTVAVWAFQDTSGGSGHSGHAFLLVMLGMMVVPLLLFRDMVPTATSKWFHPAKNAASLRGVIRCADQPASTTDSERRCFLHDVTLLAPKGGVLLRKLDWSGAQSKSSGKQSKRSSRLVLHSESGEQHALEGVLVPTICPDSHALTPPADLSNRLGIELPPFTDSVKVATQRICDGDVVEVFLPHNVAQSAYRGATTGARHGGTGAPIFIRKVLKHRA